ncbi:Phospholipid/glycerol acyltransferase family protein [Rhynchospora pubera]|uniref:Tafazzin family protein n=1 Tax=Rhynchospora pubera TaxID=906938 RepID=A0AAV8E8B7_9POAL|nr:Phospholipid/glycerol acyltransferase family protein [Rhynchospora pubera]
MAMSMSMSSEWLDRDSDSDADPWLDRARALKNRIRDRFRVAVDRRRRHRVKESDYTVAIQRWSHRIRSFFDDRPRIVSASARSASASLRLYRQSVDKDKDDTFDSDSDSLLLRLLQSLAVPVLGNACHVFMHGLNYVHVYGIEKLHDALLHRPQAKPLITASNHVAAIDDPFVIASLLPPSVMLNANNLRWTLCATDRCFKNPAMSAFFRSVKVLPVSRGHGIYQKGMDMALSKLNKGGWVHIFPEGSRSRDGGKTIGPAKRGVGRLVMDADNMPIVLPFVHSGMQDIMPVGTKFPNIGKKVIVVVGDPLSFDDLLPNKKEVLDPESREILYDLVSSRIGLKLQELKTQADKLALEKSLQISVQNESYSLTIWQHVDWEAFGMDYLLESSDTATHIDAKKEGLKQVEQLLVPYEESNVYSTSNDRFCHKEGSLSRVPGYMNPSEFVGFAARGLFVNGRCFGG